MQTVDGLLSEAQQALSKYFYDELLRNRGLI